MKVTRSTVVQVVNNVLFDPIGRSVKASMKQMVSTRLLEDKIELAAPGRRRPIGLSAH